MDSTELVSFEHSFGSFLFLVNLSTNTLTITILTGFICVLQMYFSKLVLEYSLFKRLKPFIFAEIENSIFNRCKNKIITICNIIIPIIILNLLVILTLQSLNKNYVPYIMISNIIYMGCVFYYVTCIMLIQYTNIIMTKILRKSEELESAMEDLTS